MLVPYSSYGTTIWITPDPHAHHAVNMQSSKYTMDYQDATLEMHCWRKSLNMQDAFCCVGLMEDAYRVDGPGKLYSENLSEETQ